MTSSPGAGAATSMHSAVPGRARRRARPPPRVRAAVDVGQHRRHRPIAVRYAVRACSARPALAAVRASATSWRNSCRSRLPWSRAHLRASTAGSLRSAGRWGRRCWHAGAASPAGFAARAGDRRLALQYGTPIGPGTVSCIDSPLRTRSRCTHRIARERRSRSNRSLAASSSKGLSSVLLAPPVRAFRPYTSPFRPR